MKDIYEQVDKITEVARKLSEVRDAESEWMYNASSLQIYTLFLIEMRKLINEVLGEVR